MKFFCFFLEYTNFKDNLIEYKCLRCKKSYQHKIDEKLKERFFNTHIFSKHDNNKFILLLQKRVYPYEYIDDLEKFSEASLPGKKRYLETQICKILLMQIMSMKKEVQSDTLLLADVFEKFRSMCIEIYELDLAKFLSALG